MIILPDNIRNYMTKHLNKTWMVENKFISYDELKEEGHPLNGKGLAELNLPEATTLDVESATVGEVYELLKTNFGIPLTKDGKIVSVVF